MLRTRQSPCLLPPLVNMKSGIVTAEQFDAKKLIENITFYVQGVNNSLIAAKISQAHHANKECLAEPAFKVRN
jgi:uncharacterized membrane protein